MNAWRMLIAAVAVSAGMVAPAGAEAYSGTTRQLSELLERGGGRQVPGLNCGPVCEQWYVDEHRPYPNSPASRDLHRELYRARQRVGLLPRLSRLGSRVIPAAAVFQIGWEIGSALSESFGISPVFDNSYYGTAVTIKPFDQVFTATGIDPVPGPGYHVWVGGTPFVRVKPGSMTPCHQGQYAAMAAARRHAGFHRRYETPEGDIEGCASGFDTVYLFRGLAGGGDSPLRATLPSGVPSVWAPSQGSDWLTGPPSSPEVLDQRVEQDVLANPEDFATLLPWLDHQVDPQAPDPTDINVIAMPSCIGLSWNACLTALQTAGFGAVTRETVGWEVAEPLPDGQPTEVLSTVPAPGEETTIEQEVLVTTNPDEEAMPFLMPDLRGKTETEARALLEPYGWGDAQFTFTVRADEDVDLEYGPDTITNTVPAPGSRVQGDAPAPEVTGGINPSTAPIPGGSGGSCGLQAPTVALDTSPITDAQLGDKFPFAFVGWLGSAIVGVAGSSAPPNASFTVGPETIDLQFLENFEPIVTIMRNLFAFLLWIGAGWFLYGRTIGRGV